MADTVEVHRVIAAAPEKLWEMVSDVTRMGEWSPETVSCKWRGGASGPEVGARFTGANRQGWRRWSTQSEVVDCEPGEVFAFDVTAGPIAVARWEYRFEPVDEGCRVTELWTDHRPGIAATLTGWATGVSDRAEHNRAGMEHTLERLEAAATHTSA